MPKSGRAAVLTSLRQKLIKIGAKVVSHGSCVTFQLAAVGVPRQILTDIPRLVAPDFGRRLHRHGGAIWLKGRPPWGEVFRAEGKATGSSLARRTTRRFGYKRGVRDGISLRRHLDEAENRADWTENPGNVSSCG